LVAVAIGFFFLPSGRCVKQGHAKNCHSAIYESRSIPLQRVFQKQSPRERLPEDRIQAKDNPVCHYWRGTPRSCYVSNPRASDFNAEEIPSETLYFKYLIPPKYLSPRTGIPLDGMADPLKLPF